MRVTNRRSVAVIYQRGSAGEYTEKMATSPTTIKTP
jgi:hypothetical protein